MGKICLSVDQYLHFTASIPFYLNLTINLSVFLSFCLDVSVSFSTCMSLSLSLFLSLSLSLSPCLSVSLSLGHKSISTSLTSVHNLNCPNDHLFCQNWSVNDIDNSVTLKTIQKAEKLYMLMSTKIWNILNINT
jgi:hypothetical protein